MFDSCVYVSKQIAEDEISRRIFCHLYSSFQYFSFQCVTHIRNPIPNDNFNPNSNPNLLNKIPEFDPGSSISNAVDAVAISSKAQTIKENVMLFEDILEDLQAGYVDPVNPTKLFETAVSAMLKVSTSIDVRISLSDMSRQDYRS